MLWGRLLIWGFLVSLAACAADILADEWPQNPLEINLGLSGGTLTERINGQHQSIASGGAELGIGILARRIGWYPELAFVGTSAEPIDERAATHPYSEITMNADQVHLRMNYRYKRIKAYVGFGVAAWRQSHFLDDEYINSHYMGTVGSLGTSLTLFETDEGTRLNIFGEYQRHLLSPYRCLNDECLRSRDFYMQNYGLSLTFVPSLWHRTYNSGSGSGLGFAYIPGPSTVSFAYTGMYLSKAIFSAILRMR